MRVLRRTNHAVERGLRPGSFPISDSNEPGRRPALQCFAFPTAQRIAATTEPELRACKMGFRAPSLLAAARQIADGSFDLEKIRGMDYTTARLELMKLRGVGGKIADCVLLFAYGFDTAFPVDVWIERALQGLYSPTPGQRQTTPQIRCHTFRPSRRLCTTIPFSLYAHT